MSRPALDLALVVPVRDDAAGLSRLLDQASGRFTQVVVVDDGSTPMLQTQLDLSGVRLLRHPVSVGAGVARNLALAVVETEYLLYFDADDLLCPAEFDRLLKSLAVVGTFDLCLFKHCDSRLARAGLWGQPGWDERFWTATDLGLRALAEAPSEARPLLSRTANYPWNKICRTDFLHDNGLGCAETTLHEDIPLHWGALISAERMLVSDRVCAWHDIRRGSGQHHDRRGTERMQVFEALEPAVVQALAAGPAWGIAVADFALGLVDWVAERLEIEQQEKLRRAERVYLNRWFGPQINVLAGQDRGLARRVLERADAGRVTQ